MSPSSNPTISLSSIVISSCPSHPQLSSLSVVSSPPVYCRLVEAVITIANMGYHTESELIYCSQQYLLRSFSFLGVSMSIVPSILSHHTQIRYALPPLCHLLIYLGILVPSASPSASPPSPQVFRLQQQAPTTVPYPSFLFPDSNHGLTASPSSLDAKPTPRDPACRAWSGATDTAWLPNPAKTLLLQWAGKKATEWTHANEFSVQYDGALADLMRRPVQAADGSFLPDRVSKNRGNDAKNEMVELPEALMRLLQSPALSFQQLDKLDANSQNLL